LRRKRTEALKKQEEKKAEWRANGHGSYEEIPEEKEFFNVTRKSDNCVIQVSSDLTNGTNSPLGGNSSFTQKYVRKT